MKHCLRILLSIFALFCVTASAAENAAAPAANGAAFDFAAPDAVADLGAAIAPRDAGASSVRDAWYTVAVKNGDAAKPLARVFTATDSPGDGLQISPMPMRPRLIDAAGSGAGILVERAMAFGPNAFRVTLPPMQTATLALHFEGAGDRPSLLVWAEPALIAHNRQIAILAGMVSGLLAAAAAFAAGAAVLSGRIFPRWEIGRAHV